MVRPPWNTWKIGWWNGKSYGKWRRNCEAKRVVLIGTSSFKNKDHSPPSPSTIVGIGWNWEYHPKDFDRRWFGTVPELEKLRVTGDPDVRCKT